MGNVDENMASWGILWPRNDAEGEIFFGFKPGSVFLCSSHSL